MSDFPHDKWHVANMQYYPCNVCNTIELSVVEIIYKLLYGRFLYQTSLITLVCANCFICAYDTISQQMGTEPMQEMLYNLCNKLSLEVYNVNAGDWELNQCGPGYLTSLTRYIQKLYIVAAYDDKYQTTMVMSGENGGKLSFASGGNDLQPLQYIHRKIWWEFDED